MPIQSLNPATGEIEKKFDPFTKEKTIQVVEQVAETYRSWKTTSFEQRAAGLRSLAEKLREKADELAEIMTREMGKPVAAGKGEVLKCAMVCDFYAENGAKMLADEQMAGCGKRAYIQYAPQGTVLSVMPWNFPYWQVFRIAAPTMMAGNTMVLKHASNVPQCALAIDKIFAESDLPDNVFRTLLIGADLVETVLDQDSVIGVSLTGSEGAGSKVASAAGARLKKSVMELGGSDPFIVLADADITPAVKVGVPARFANSGQVCIAAKRFIVEEPVFDEFLAEFKAETEKLKMGDPMAPDTNIGPMASLRLREELQEQVDRCVKAGGKILCGGKPSEGTGAYYPCTIITDVDINDPVCKEELFGPVAMVFKVKDKEEAIAVANDTPFGLGGSVWTKDEAKGEEIARKVEAGAVFVNGMVRSDPHLPFGGIGCSGFGRELAHYGIREFTNIKSVCID